MSDKKQEIPVPTSSQNESVSSPSPTVPSPLPSATPESHVSVPVAPQPTTLVQPLVDRGELVSKARAFLASPQIMQQDATAKRTFLREKGLNDDEIEGLMRENPSQPPIIPPRSYPQPPPSNLPHLLLGVLRLFSWLAGGSAVLVLIYYRFLLPRITQTSQARNALKSHHLVLLQRLTSSLSALKETQAESFAVLPRPQPFKEPDAFASCRTVEEVLKVAGEKADITTIHPVTLLRCAILDLSKGREGVDAHPLTEDLFRYLEGRIPWLVEPEGARYEETLWDTLNTCPFFSKYDVESSPANAEVDSPPSPDRWSYREPAPIPPPALVQSLDELSSQMPKTSTSQKSAYQHALQTLSDFTGYISTQIYLPYRPSGVGMGVSSGTTPTPVEEEFKRDIRALKGLVLNRRTFMPTIPRPFANNNIPPPRVTSS